MPSTRSMRSWPPGECHFHLPQHPTHQIGRQQLERSGTSQQQQQQQQQQPKITLEECNNNSNNNKGGASRGRIQVGKLIIITARMLIWLLLLLLLLICRNLRCCCQVLTTGSGSCGRSDFLLLSRWLGHDRVTFHVADRVAGPTDAGRKRADEVSARHSAEQWRPMKECSLEANTTAGGRICARSSISLMLPSTFTHEADASRQWACVITSLSLFLAFSRVLPPSAGGTSCYDYNTHTHTHTDYISACVTSHVPRLEHSPPSRLVLSLFGFIRLLAFSCGSRQNRVGRVATELPLLLHLLFAELIWSQSAIIARHDGHSSATDGHR
jgi:hypothetical protein